MESEWRVRVSEGKSEWARLSVRVSFSSVFTNNKKMN